jgi:hypothetical protein
MAIGKRASDPDGSRRFRRVITASVLFVGVGLAGSAGAGAATPKAGSVQVLHFFSKSQSMTFSTAAGKPFSPSKADPPAAGDDFESTDFDYVGNHLHHAATWKVSDHVLCVFPPRGDPVCHAQIAIGGSMILLRGLATGAARSPFVVTGGTGRFEGVTGSLVSVNIDPSSERSDSDLTIMLRRP